jgi:hypothetical protein
MFRYLFEIKDEQRMQFTKPESCYCFFHEKQLVACAGVVRLFAMGSDFFSLGG